MADRQLTPFERLFFRNRSASGLSILSGPSGQELFTAELQQKLEEFMDRLLRETAELSRRQKALEETVEKMRNDPEKPEITEIL